MPTTPPLSLSDIVDITVSVAVASPSANSFNQGLFIGPTAVTANGRLSQYTSVSALLSAGYTTASPEYIAAQIYFSQTQPASYIWIGHQDATAIATAVPDGRTFHDASMSSSVSPTDLHSTSAGAFTSADVGMPVRVIGAGAAGADLVTTVSAYVSSTDIALADPCLTTVSAAQASVGYVGHGYAVNDTFSVTQTGGSGSLLKVLTVGTSGVPLTLGVTAGQQGTGYTVASALPTVATAPSAGIGLEVNITVGESLVNAAISCRAASAAWYGLSVYNPSDADNLALAAWADSQWQTTRYYAWSSSTAIPAGTAGNIALQLQTLKYRTLLSYSTTQTGLYPNNVYIASAVMGMEMGLNTGLANSFFTAAHKSLIGIAAEPLSQTQYTNIKNAGCNAYCNFSPYQLYEPGVMSSGAPSYLWLFLAVLVANMQINEMNVLTGNPAVARTNADEQLLLDAANQACSLLADIGFLSGAIWEGRSLSITGVSMLTGQALPLGYSNQAQPYSQQSAADRDAGKAMPIYSFITTSGAVQSLVIGVTTQL